MSFSTTSKYVQLTPYLLMEYMYASTPDPETHFVNTGPTVVGYDKLINGYQSDAVQIFNPSDSYSISHNTRDDSVVQIGTNSFVTLDSNLIIPFNDYSDKLTNTIDLPITFPSNLLVVYDTVRYHIRAGYNLSNIDGLIMKIELQDQNLNYVTLSQILLKKGTQQTYYLNPKPITVGSNIYDKYFEIKIPSPKDMNDKYQSASTTFQPQTLASLISQSGYGFVYGAPIRISAWQVQSTTDFDGYSRYDCARISMLSLEQEDPFSNIGATIQESSQGQFFEYFATDNKGFIEDFILFQNSIGNSYYISHQIQVIEQIGAALIETSRFESIQTTAYDSPNYYRPIVRNAAYAASFFLRYTMSLINSADQSSVIRTASYSSSNPSQWGNNITPIKLQNLPQVQKIYNRVYSQPQITGYNPSPQPREIVKYTNVFIQQNYVTATSTNLTYSSGMLVDNTGSATTTALGLGKLTISISPFDNYIKFKFIKSTQDGVPVSIDLSNSGLFKISFLDAQGNKTYIPALNDNNIAKPASGELAFKIDEASAVKILQFSDRRFFITNGNPGNTTPQINQAVNSAQTFVAETAVPVGTSNLIRTSSSAPVTESVSNRLSYVSDRAYAPVSPTSDFSTASLSPASSSLTEALNVTSSLAPYSTSVINPTSLVNQSASVLYWGYWKKEGEADVVQPSPVTPTPTGATGNTSAVIGLTSGINLSEVLKNTPVSVLQTIGPPSSQTTSGSSGTTATGVPSPPLTGADLQSALSSQIQGYKSSGWSDSSIVSYFLTPGKPGYVQYPGLTIDQFAEAAEGILAPATIDALVNPNKGNVKEK